MLGTWPIGAEALGGLPAAYDLSIPSPLPALLNDPEMDLVFLAVVRPLPDAGGAASDFPYAIGEEPIGALKAGDFAETTTLRWGDRTYLTGSADDPANDLFAPRLKGPYNFEVAIPVPASGKSLGDVAFGVIVVANDDRELDPFLSYSWEGRPIDLLIGGTYNAGRADERVLALDEYWTLRRTVAGIATSGDDLQISIRDPWALLDRPVQDSLYAGTGALEGGANIAGLPRPRCFGRARNLPAVIVDEASLVYQVNDGSIEAISAVRDKGVALTSDGDISTLSLASVYDWSPVPGHYITDLASGLFRLGAKPQGGLVTADVDGDNTGGWASTTPEIVRRLATRYGGLVDPDDLDAVSFADFENTGVIGYYTGTIEQSVATIIDRLLVAADGWASMTRDGRLQIGTYRAPENEVATETLTANLIEGVESEPAPDVAWTVRIGYKRMWEVQHEDGLAAIVSEADRATYARELRYVTVQDLDARARHWQSRDFELETFFDDSATAGALGAALLARQKERRRIYRIRAERQLFQRNPGAVICVCTDDAGLQSPKNLLVLSVAENVPGRAVDLVLWG